MASTSGNRADGSCCYVKRMCSRRANLTSILDAEGLWEIVIHTKTELGRIAVVNEANNAPIASQPLTGDKLKSGIFESAHGKRHR